MKANEVYFGSMQEPYRFYSAWRQPILFTSRVGWARITKVDALILDEHWYMSTIVELLTVLVVMHKIFTLDEVISTANSDKIWK